MAKSFTRGHVASFAPFAALAGFSDALEARRAQHEADTTPPSLAPEREEEIARALATVTTGEDVVAGFWHEGRKSCRGIVRKIDRQARTLTIGTTCIPFATLTSLEINGERPSV